MKEELTLEVLEAMKKCEYPQCGLCELPKDKKCKTVKKEIRKLAAALLEEMDKPKVWDGAPDESARAAVTFYGNGKLCGTREYTREPPKTRIDELADEAVKKLGIGFGAVTDVEQARRFARDVIKEALEKYSS